MNNTNIRLTFFKTIWYNLFDDLIGDGMPSIDLDDEFLELFYNITNSKPPKDLELLDLKKQLINIVDTLKELNSNAKSLFTAELLILVFRMTIVKSKVPLY